MYSLSTCLLPESNILKGVAYWISPHESWGSFLQLLFYYGDILGHFVKRCSIHTPPVSCCQLINGFITGFVVGAASNENWVLSSFITPLLSRVYNQPASTECKCTTATLWRAAVVVWLPHFQETERDFIYLCVQPKSSLLVIRIDFQQKKSHLSTGTATIPVRRRRRLVLVRVRVVRVKERSAFMPRDLCQFMN